ncbi:MAG TPA: hypothetical protein VFA04_21420 [Bryobacteraceae bacterium]|nr:hypothetical protein [Bryobacteraceae bacterium]
MRRALIITAALSVIPAFASAVSSATVAVSNGTGTPCFQSSPGTPPLTCTTGDGTANASASASFGNLVALAAETTTPGAVGGSAMASSNASFDEMVIITGGTGSGTAIGNYEISLTSTGAIFPVATIAIGQGSMSANYCSAQDTRSGCGTPSNSDVFSGPVTLSSSFTYGVPFTLSGSLGAIAASPGDQSAAATLTFTGFTDQTGKALAFALVAVPEPGAAGTMLGAAAVLFLIGTLRRRTR